MTCPTPEQVKSYAAKLASNAQLASVDEKALHTYRSEEGTPLYWRVRLKCNSTGEKWIRPFMWNGTAFDPKEPPAPDDGKPLYGLERLTTPPKAVAIICEGENCADAMNKALAKWDAAGFVALTSGGATSAQAANWQPLAGRSVYVFPDNDDAGAKYASDVVERLQGIAGSVAVLDIAPLSLPHKGDAVDWIEAGGVLDNLLVMIDATRSSPVNNGSEPIQGAQGGRVQVTTTPAESDAGTIARLALLSPLDYDRTNKASAKALGVNVSALNKAVTQARRDKTKDEGISFADCEPYPHPIDPATLLSEISDTVKRFVICQPETADGVALWATLTWFIDVVQVAPIAVITAPEKRCGKSLLLFLLGRLSRRPLTASNISPAALFRVIDAWQPTLLIDEADAFMRENEELRGLLNCGHTRDSAYTVRIVGESMTPTRFNVWGAKAIAGIGHLADTLMDRAICFELRRKKPNENTERLRHAEPDLFNTLAAKLAKFANDYSAAVRLARPHLPNSLNDRAQDNWEGLLAIASCAGDEWLARATTAALKLSGETTTAQSVGNELLADIQTLFDLKKVDRISTADLITALCEDDEAAWNTYNKGKQLSPRQLATRLREYGISSKTIRLGAYDTPKGFELAQFADAFARYLATPLNLPRHPQQTLEVNKYGVLSVSDNPPQQAIRNSAATSEAPPLLDCGGVADKTSIFLGTNSSQTNTSHLRI